MNLDFILNLESMPDWRILQNEVLSKKFPLYQDHLGAMDSFSLVYVLTGKDGKPTQLKYSEQDVPSFCIFTKPELANRAFTIFSSEEVQGGGSGKTSGIPSDYNLKVMMLGELVSELSMKSKETPIKVNPLGLTVATGMEPMLYAEEVLFAPQRDEFTGKLLLTDPEDARALLAINPEDQKRFGIELVFYMLTTRGLPEEREERDNILKERIEELSFKAPRIPMKKGSGTFLAVLLNLENDLEERAFIRDYPMFDEYADIIFVTSTLKMMTGRLEEVNYNGAKIDSIFGPLIDWQRNKNFKRAIRF